MPPRGCHRCVICDQTLSDHQHRVGKTCDSPGCRFAYRQRLQSGKPGCAVCGRPLTLVEQARRDDTCFDRACKIVFAAYVKRPQHDRPARCAICHIILPQNAQEPICRDRECRALLAAERDAAVRAEKRRKMHERRQRLLQDACRRRDDQAEREGMPEPEAYRVTLVPYISRGLTNLPERRRRKFRDYLNGLVSQASEAKSGDAPPIDNEIPAGAAPPDPVEATLLQASCATCRGYCCVTGAEDAWLRVETIRRYMDSHPELRPRQVLADYLSRIPNRTIRDSCVYHGESGCALPREMRSDKCNQWYCVGLEELREDFSRRRADRIYVAAADESEIVASNFVDVRELVVRPRSNEAPGMSTQIQVLS